MAGWNCEREVVPFTVMAIAEFSAVGVNTLYKAATLNGLSYFVFIAYTSLIGTLVLVPLPFIFPRRELPTFKISFLYRILLLAVIGISYSVSEFIGIAYSSPTLASAIGNLQPAFTYVFAIIFGMEHMNLRSSTTRIKIIGTIFSIAGALIAVLYKGPTILSPESSSPHLLSPALQYPMGMLQTNWVIGGLLLVTETFLGAIWNIFQTQAVELYPDEQTVTLIYFIYKTALALPICFLAETKSTAWRLKPDMWVTIVISGLFGPTFGTLLCTLGLRLKGPLYISIFKPFSIAIAAAFGVIFLGEALCLGSVLGAIILLIGVYAVIWGKAQVEDTGDCGLDNLGASTDRKIPLLQSHIAQDIENSTRE